MTVVCSTHEEGVTRPCHLSFKNGTTSAVSVLWVQFDGSERQYALLPPGRSAPQHTYTTHIWRLRAGTKLVGEYTGPSAKLHLRSDGQLDVVAMPDSPGGADGGDDDDGDDPDPRVPKPEWGVYGQRGLAAGVIIQAYDCVCDEAVRQAAHIVARMLESSPEAVARRLVAGGARVAIIGRDQVTTDIPEHAFMRRHHQEGERDIDATTRGLGGTAEVPTTSCGEENLTMVDDRWYRCENILVHEFGHCVMNVGLCEEERDAVHALYQKACECDLYDKDCYMSSNADEYWAEGTQAWFDASVRTDVNDGINTRETLRAHDPGLAAAMQGAYGDGVWRYPHDSPAALSNRSVTPSTASPPTLAAATPMSLIKANPKAKSEMSFKKWVPQLLFSFTGQDTSPPSRTVSGVFAATASAPGGLPRPEATTSPVQKSPTSAVVVSERGTKRDRWDGLSVPPESASAPDQQSGMERSRLADTSRLPPFYGAGAAGLCASGCGGMPMSGMGCGVPLAALYQMVWGMLPGQPPRSSGGGAGGEVKLL